VQVFRPIIQVLDPADLSTIAAEACQVLQAAGFLVENREAVELLASAGLKVQGQRVFASEAAIQQALATVPSRVVVYNRQGDPALDLGGDRVHFNPGSAAVFILDPVNGRRRAVTRDLVHLAWVTESCANIAGQSTALVPSDVPEVMGDWWRLSIALQASSKPVITGTFRKESFAVMREFLEIVRGSSAALRAKPLAIFDCCPSPPLKWSDLTCQALLDCARSGIPAELVSMPLGGAAAPVTLRGMIIQHCAENLSGALIHQLAAPGAPIIYGGSPAPFDMRHGTTPMGAVETHMVDIACAQTGRYLGFPVHAYMGPSDAKTLDFQAGAEAWAGIMSAALAGINLVSGPGLLDFENCQSLEKILWDNELCGMALRLVRGISRGEAGETARLLSSGDAGESFLVHPHTRAHFRQEHYLPSRMVDRASHGAWEARGRPSAADSAAAEVAARLAKGNIAPLDPVLQRELSALAAAEAAVHGVARLPQL